MAVFLSKDILYIPCHTHLVQDSTNEPITAVLFLHLAFQVCFCSWQAKPEEVYIDTCVGEFSSQQLRA